MGWRRSCADRKSMRRDILPVERLNGSLSALRRRHRDDSGPERPTTIAIHRQIHFRDITMFGKQPMEFGFGGCWG